MRDYALPKGLRPKLKKVWGKPIFGTRKEIEKKFEDFRKKKKFKKIVAVGDFCSKFLFSDVKIFDGKIGRKKIKKILDFSLKVNNPPGKIKKEVWKVLREAICKNKNVFVEGEEDLLVIPAVLLSPKKTAVIYGFPKKGICLIEVNQRTKRKIKNLLKLFSKCEQ
jgi:hypothetical protein